MSQLIHEASLKFGPCICKHAATHPQRKVTLNTAIVTEITVFKTINI